MTTLIPYSPSTLRPTWHPELFIPTEEALPALSISFHPLSHPTFTCIYSNFCPGSQPLLLTASSLFSQQFTNLLKGGFGTCQSQNQTPSMASPLEFYIRGLAQSLDLQTWSCPCPVNSWCYPCTAAWDLQLLKRLSFFPVQMHHWCCPLFLGCHTLPPAASSDSTQHAVLHLNAICSVRPSAMLASSPTWLCFFIFSSFLNFMIIYIFTFVCDITYQHLDPQLSNVKVEAASVFFTNGDPGSF